MKKVVALLLTIILVFSNSTIGLAEERPPEDQISTNPNFAQDIWFAPIQAQTDNGDGPLFDGGDGLQLVMVCSSISPNGAGVSVFAETDANLICGEIGGTIHIQRWSNNEWNNYYSFVFSEDSVSSASISQTISVQSGYYYRVSVSHYAATAASVKRAHTTTQSILIQ